MGKLFGTDGIRGKFGEFPLDVDSLFKIGYLVGTYYLDLLGRPARFVTGRDTRESGRALEAALSAGIVHSGSESHSAGVITTPGVAYSTSSEGRDAGIVISASHNPFEDNGIKIFTPSGKKAGVEVEEFVEQALSLPSELKLNEDFELDESHAEKYQADYIDHLYERFSGLDLTGKSLVVDCANGAASFLAPELFRRFGADVTEINASPDGRNINLDCGSLHLEGLQAAVRASSADLGIAFDGDADRALFVDENGEIVDGDATLWVISQQLLKIGELKSKKVIATHMSNIGLEIALREQGIELVRKDVGDKYVLEGLLQSGAEIGGEQSGHIIFPAMSLVGDGMLTSLLLLQAINATNARISELTTGFQKYPQILVNVKVQKKMPFDEIPAIREHAQKVNATLEGNGRLLLRYSGTENLARVMIEGRDQDEITELAHALAGTIREALAA